MRAVPLSAPTVSPAAARQPAVPARWLIWLAFAVVYGVWGTSYYGIVVAMETIPPFIMSGIRFLLAALALGAVAWWQGVRWPTLREWRGSFIVGALLFLVNNGLLVYAEHNGLASGTAALLIGVLPMWMVLIAWLRGTRPGVRMLAGLGLGSFGILLLVDPFGGGGPALDNVILVLLAALAWAVGSLYARGSSLPANTMLSTAMQLFWGAVLQFGVAALTGSFAEFDTAAISSRSLLATLYLAFVSSGLAFTAFTWLMRVSDPARVSTYAYVNPIIALLLGAQLNQEVLTPLSLVAAACIIGAVVVINHANAHSARRAAAAEAALSAAPVPEATSALAEEANEAAASEGAPDRTRSIA
jgi:drug/metabolite transporter (DMT)-like permease